MSPQEMDPGEPCVLVVERDLDVRGALVDVVSAASRGTPAVARASVEQALRDVAGRRVDAAIVEDMPGARDLVAALQAGGTAPAIVVLGYQSEDASARWAGRPVRFVTRPATATQLAAALEETRAADAGRSFMAMVGDAEEATS